MDVLQYDRTQCHISRREEQLRGPTIEQKTGLRCDALDGIGRYHCITACGDDDEWVGFAVQVFEVEPIKEDDSCCDNVLFEAQLLSETMCSSQKNERPSH